MICESDPHHVVYLAFMPVCGGPEMNDRRYFEVILRNASLQPQMNIRAERIKFVNDLEPWFITKIVHAGKVGEKIKAEILLCEPAGGFDLVGRKFQADLAAKISSVNDLKLALKPGSSFFKSHERVSNSNFMSPPNKASGRGGHPLI